MHANGTNSTAFNVMNEIHSKNAEYGGGIALPPAALWLSLRITMICCVMNTAVKLALRDYEGRRQRRGGGVRRCKSERTYPLFWYKRSEDKRGGKERTWM